MTLTLTGCTLSEANLKLVCQGTKRVIQGKSEQSHGMGIRETETRRTYDFSDRKFKGEHACQVWAADHIRCEIALPDGTFYQLLKVDRVKHELKDQVYKNQHGVAEEILFDATCDEAHD